MEALKLMLFCLHSVQRTIQTSYKHAEHADSISSFCLPTTSSPTFLPFMTSGFQNKILLTV